MTQPRRRSGKPAGAGWQRTFAGWWRGPSDSGVMAAKKIGAVILLCNMKTDNAATMRAFLGYSKVFSAAANPATVDNTLSRQT